jgi:thiamine-phosphate pyrophosphorylase
VGLSSHAPEQFRRAEEAGADYVAVGPVFPTGTKPGRAAVTLDYVRWAAANARKPWFAIGGITTANLGEVLDAGARRVCVVSAILRSPDVRAATAEFSRRCAAAG